MRFIFELEIKSVMHFFNVQAFFGSIVFND